MAWETFLEFYMQNSPDGSFVKRGDTTKYMCSKLNIRGGAAYAALDYFRNRGLIELGEESVKLSPMIYNDMKRFRLSGVLRSAIVMARSRARPSTQSS